MYASISRSDAEESVHAPSPLEGTADPVFQRGRGEARLVFSMRHGQSLATERFQSGTMKLRFPRVEPGLPPETVLVNLGGGMTGGDRLDIAAELTHATSATITTQACEKIYRSLGDDALIKTSLHVDEGAKLDWLPQPAIFFDGARLRRETHVTLAADAAFLGVEASIFGRTAMDETVRKGALSDSWFIRRDGRLIHADRFHIDGDIDERLKRPAIAGGHLAMATLRYVAPDAEDRLEEMRSLLASLPDHAAASAWDGMLIARFMTADGHALTKALCHVLTGFRKTALPRNWLI